MKCFKPVLCFNGTGGQVEIWKIAALFQENCSQDSKKGKPVSLKKTWKHSRGWRCTVLICGITMTFMEESLGKVCSWDLPIKICTTSLQMSIETSLWTDELNNRSF